MSEKVNPYMIDHLGAFAKLRALANEHSPGCDVVAVFYNAKTNEAAVISSGLDGRILGDKGCRARIEILRHGIEVEQEPDYVETVKTQ
jgi:hypothetical protein